MKQSFPFPGNQTITDGNGAVVWVDTHAVTGASAYPITPSSAMGAGFEQAVADGGQNVWGDPLVFLEPESEHSSATVCEGYALAGGRVSNFTSGQGLILMKEVLYVIAGKRLPVVFHIGARALTVQALNIHAGHDDVMGVADCGWGMLFARNAQEACDFALISRKTAEDSLTPFMNIQDGFLTTHTVENVLLPEPELIKTYLKPPKEALHNFIDPDDPVMTGTLQNQDAYMRGKVAQRAFYRKIKGHLIANMKEFYRLTGRRYDLIDGHRMGNAEYAIVGMGSYMETAKVTIDALRKQRGEKVGLITLHSYRPFPGAELVEALRNVKVVSVLERLDDANALENPLARELKAAFADALWGHADFTRVDRVPVIQHGAGGLGSRDVRVHDFQAIVANMKRAEQGKIRYCIGIQHEDALACDEDELDTRPEGYFAMRGHSVGGFGSITTNKVIASVCAELFGLHVQAYPKYGAEKKGMPTLFFLAAGNTHIETHQDLEIVDFVAINDTNAIMHGDPLKGLVEGGAVFLQIGERDPKAVWNCLPESVQRVIRERRIMLYCLDAAEIAKEVARLPNLVVRMQGIVLLGVFLRVTRLAREHGMDDDAVLAGIEKVVRKFFGGKGEQAVEDNMTCIRRGFNEIIEVSDGVK